METSVLKAIARKKKRVLRIRKKIQGTADKPRICVNKSNKQLFVQLIDDQNSQTLVSLSSLSKQVNKGAKACNVETAKEMGSLIAQEVEKKGIKTAVLDRRGNKYHGQIAALTDALREKGIKI